LAFESPALPSTSAAGKFCISIGEHASAYDMNKLAQPQMRFMRLC